MLLLVIFLDFLLDFLIRSYGENKVYGYDMLKQVAIFAHTEDLTFAA